MGGPRLLEVRRDRESSTETRLAGDRLLDGRYEPVPIETIEDGVMQGYSSVLNLFIQWEHGELRWHDPETGQHIMTFKQERDRADAAEGQGPGTRSGAGPKKQRKLEDQSAQTPPKTRIWNNVSHHHKTTGASGSSKHNPCNMQGAYCSPVWNRQ